MDADGVQKKIDALDAQLDHIDTLLSKSLTEWSEVEIRLNVDHHYLQQQNANLQQQKANLQQEKLLYLNFLFAQPSNDILR
jgi:restriction endonuclease S subunit